MFISIITDNYSEYIITPRKTLSRNNNNNSKVFISALRNLNVLTCLLITKNKYDYDNNSQLTTTRLLQVVPLKNNTSVTLCTVNRFLRFLWSCSFGTNLFWLVGLVFFVCFIGKKSFLLWLIHFSKQPRTWLKWLKTMGSTCWSFSRHSICVKCSRGYRKTERRTCKCTAIAVFMQLQKHFIKWNEQRNNVLKSKLYPMLHRFKYFTVRKPERILTPSLFWDCPMNIWNEWQFKLLRKLYFLPEKIKSNSKKFWPNEKGCFY